MKRGILIILFIVAIILTTIFMLIGKKEAVSEQQNPPPIPSLSINGHLINLEIADTVQKRTAGLSGRSSLPQDTGMLFIFDSPQKYQFWMYEMKFPLDFIWLDGNKVVQIDENVPAPAENGPIAAISPKYAADKILEVNVGFIESTGIKAGDEVKINL